VRFERGRGGRGGGKEEGFSDRLQSTIPEQSFWATLVVDVVRVRRRKERKRGKEESRGIEKQGELSVSETAGASPLTICFLVPSKREWEKKEKKKGKK